MNKHDKLKEAINLLFEDILSHVEDSCSCESGAICYAALFLNKKVSVDEVLRDFAYVGV